MAPLTNISEFKSLQPSQKFEVFDHELSDSVELLDDNATYQLLKGIILDSSENNNIRKRALSALTDLVFLKKIKTRQALNILIDEWPIVADIFLELQRLKDLFFYYTEARTEIVEIYKRASEDLEVEISSEANFQLGLITFQIAVESNSQSDRSELLNQSDHYLSTAIRSIENRDDAIFFQKTVSIIRHVTESAWTHIDTEVEELANILFQREVKSFHFKTENLLISIYRSLNELILLRTSDVGSSLDIREHLVSIFSHYSDIQNQRLKDRLNESDLSELFVNLITKEFVEPFFALNLGAELSRIEARISEVDTTSEEGKFLFYLEELLSNADFKKKVESQSLKDKFRKIFPVRSDDAIDKTIKKIINNTDPGEIINAYFDLTKPSIEKFVDTLVHACIRLQGNRIYRGKFSEDDRNTFIANMLTAANYLVKDQTRWSVSAKQKSAGEIDIYVQDERSYPYAIIEALNLDSLDKQYLILHLDKLFNYDTVGQEANVILVYSTAKNFNNFWNSYTDFILEHGFKYKVEDCHAVESYKFTNLKVAITKHLREEQSILLYHIIVDMQSLV